MIILKHQIQFYDNDKTTIILDNLFNYKNILQYAKEHYLNVVFTETKASNAVEIIYDFCQNGFELSFLMIDNYMMGLKLEPHIYCKFINANNK